MRIRDKNIRIRDGKNSDPGSGINIPDPQHCSRLDLTHSWLDLIRIRLDLIHARTDFIHIRLDIWLERMELLNANPGIEKVLGLIPASSYQTAEGGRSGEIIQL